MVDAYPLQWPHHWPRTEGEDREYAKFKCTFAMARDGVLAELRRLGTENVVISSNIPLRKDGLPHSGMREPEDPGIAVYFWRDGQEQCVPCDKWTRTFDNLRAIERTIEALRGIERWGAKDMVDAAFRGFEALPPGRGEVDPNEPRWFEVLEIERDATKQQIKLAFKIKCKVHHPDVGGSTESFQLIKKAFDEGMRS